ncbi:MAG: RNA pseudouridine synthase [Verrucomicrobiia bacterium]
MSSSPAILLDTPDFLIVDKPAPLLIHPTRPGPEPTLWHWLRETFPDQPLALVNRLDRETSGLVLVSRHPAAASTLGKMIMQRRIGKEYLALCLGHPTEVEARIDAPIDRLSKYSPQPIHIRRGIHPNGQPAVTHYQRLATRHHPQLGPISLLHVTPETGRLHQIRVHLASIGHPVVGDKLYGPDPMLYLDLIQHGWTDRHQRLLLSPRHALHATALHFLWDQTPIHLSSPLPADLAQLWNHAHP